MIRYLELPKIPDDILQFICHDLFNPLAATDKHPSHGLKWYILFPKKQESLVVTHICWNGNTHPDGGSDSKCPWIDNRGGIRYAQSRYRCKAVMIISKMQHFFCSYLLFAFIHYSTSSQMLFIVYELVHIHFLR